MDKRHDRLFREGMPVPQDIDGGSAPPPKPKPAPKPAPPASAASAPKPKPKPAPKRKDKPVEYKGYTPVDDPITMAKGGVVKSSASKRADGCAQRGRTKA
jgi:outer membrane biosynthesis protein TonB